EHSVGKHLEGDHAPEGRVFGLENAAHAALAQLFEDAVLPEEEASGAASKDLFSLELGEQAEIDERAGDKTSAVGVRQPGGDSMQRVGGDETTLAQARQEGLPVSAWRSGHETTQRVGVYGLSRP